MRIVKIDANKWEHRILLSLSNGFLSLLPIIFIVPSVESEIAMYDIGNYVMLVYAEPFWGWALNFRLFLRFLYSIFDIQSIYGLLILLKLIRYFSIFTIVSLFSYMIINHKRNPKIFIPLILSLSLGYPDRFLFYLFRIRLLFGFVIASVGLLSLELDTPNPDKKKALVRNLSGVIFLILAYIIHEILIFLLLPGIYILIRELFSLNKNTILRHISRYFHLIYFGLLLIIPTLMQIAFPIYLLGFSLTYSNRGFPFVPYYYLVLGSLFLLSIFSFYAKYRGISSNYLVDLLVKRSNMPLFLPLLSVVFFLKIPLYLQSLDRLLFAIVISIILVIHSGTQNIRVNYRFIHLMYLVIFLQTCSVIMQFWDVRASDYSALSQLDALSFFFYPLMIPNNGNLVKKIRNNTNLSIDPFGFIKTLQQIDIEKLLTLSFLILIISTPHFMFSQGKNSLPTDLAEDRAIFDQIQNDFMDKISYLLNGSKFDIKSNTTVPDWLIGMTNSRNMRYRIMAVSGNWLIDERYSSHVLSREIDVKEHLPYYDSTFDNKPLWIFYIHGFDYLEKLDDLIQSYTHEIFEVNEFASIIRIDNFISSSL